MVSNEKMTIKDVRVLVAILKRYGFCLDNMEISKETDGTYTVRLGE